MRVYLDTCSLQRPLDSRTQIRIALEAEAVIGIIALLEIEEIELVSSEVLMFEVGRNPRPERKDYALAVLDKAGIFVQSDDAIERRAREFQTSGLKPLDALHLASAEAVRADYFCTTDDQLLRRSRAIPDLAIRVVMPIELIEELES
jgi:predicted nucleic acid-binding protein